MYKALTVTNAHLVNPNMQILCQWYFCSFTTLLATFYKNLLIIAE